MKSDLSYYAWKASTIQGKKEQGIVEALTRKKALTQLNQNGLCRIQARKVSDRFTRKKLTSHKLVKFTGTLILLIESGLSLKDALVWGDKEFEGDQLGFIFGVLYSRLNEGKSLSEGLSSISACFPEFFLSSIRVVESSDHLLEILSEMKNFYSEAEDRHKKLKKIILYPLLVFFLLSVMIIGVLVFVVPMFENIYRLSEDLPESTKVIWTASIWLREYGIKVILMFSLMLLLSQFPVFQRYASLTKMTKKVTGRWVRSEDSLLFSNAMAVLLKYGVPLQSAVMIAKDPLQGDLKLEVDKVIQKLYQGKSFNDALHENTLFPEVFRKIIAVSESAGELYSGFEQVYKIHKINIANRFHRNSVMLEPILFVLMGLIVLFIVLGIYLPIFQIGDQIY